MQSTTVSTELGLRLVVPDQTAVPLVASLQYSASDPYAVTMSFHVGADEPVQWIFARELLTVGVVRETGDGDVRVWPSTAGAEQKLLVRLSSPFGEALFEAPLSQVADFLYRTYDVVPAGQESDYVDVDAELDDLLRHS